jgi:oligopeptide/dipeptide ABC transporter ATP-binding protein
LDDYLNTQDLFKWFPIRGGLLSRTQSFVRAVDGVTLRVRKGETFGLVGESGCGKTTLGRAILRLTEPTRGRITFDGEEISKCKGRQLKRIHRKMQMVFQDPYASLDPRQTVRSAIVEPMRIHKTVSSKREADQRAKELVAMVGLSRDHLARFPHEFSGGQRQRIAIAIALAVQPSFIVLDEPTSSLDVSVQSQILRLLKTIQKELGLTYVFISHNLAVVRQMCATTAVMYLGRIVELAETQRLFENPKHPYTKALLSSVPLPDPKKRRQFVPLQGDVPSPVNIPTGCRFRTRCAFATESCMKESPPMTEFEPQHRAECLYDIDFNHQTRHRASKV